MIRYPQNLYTFILLICFTFSIEFSYSQALNKAAINAFVITRMVQKYHIQPRPLDDALSNDFYNQFLKQLDVDHSYFNKSDIDQFDVYRLLLDDQIKQKQVGFLKLVISTFTTRLQQADTMIDAIAKKPFSFAANEKFTVAEDSAYPSDIAAMHNKLYKQIKLEVLGDLIDFNDDLTVKNQTQKKQILDSAQAVYQKKAISSYKRNITEILQSPGGIEKYVADEYCKALASCYDPHTEFFPLTEEENFESELGNNRFRFGFSIKEENNNGVFINGLEPGSPAYKCGLLNEGDKFETLQWEGQKAIDVSDANAEELSGILSQSNHDKLTITVKKADGTMRTVALMKEQTEADDDTKVKSYLLKGDKTFGYISLPAFYNNWEDESKGNNGCANDVAKEIIKLKQENISGLIVDLRYNGGGSINEAVELAGIFIDAGPVAQIKNSQEPKPYTLKDANRGTIYDGPLLIMVNGYSASASELVAGSLQDYHRALIVGSSTYGKATGQLVFPLDSTVNMNNLDNKQADNYIKITMDKLYRINGTTAQFTGVKPDIELPDYLQADPQREADAPFALLPTVIDSNKYYKAYPPLNQTALQAVAKQDADTIKFFSELTTYINQYKNSNKQTDVSLNWNDALINEKKDAVSTHFDSADYSANYKVTNNAFDTEKLKTDASSTELNDAFIRFLSRDPYIKVSYDLLKVMAK